MKAKSNANEQVKPKFSQKTLSRIWKYLYKYKWLLLLALVLTLLSNLFALLGPMLSGRAIDAIDPGKGAVLFERVFYYCGLMLIFYIASSVMSYLLSVLMINLSQKIGFNLRKDVFEKLADMPVSYFDTHPHGDIISRITYDIDTISASLSNDLLQICTSAITVTGSLAMMIYISPILVLVFVVTIPISIAFTRYSAGRIRPLFRKRSAKLGELNGYAEEIITGQKTVKAYRSEEIMIERFDERNEEAVNAFYNADYYGSMVGPSVGFINNLSLSLISIFGAALYMFGYLSIGNVSSFVLYSRKFSGPINELANIISELQSAMSAAERVFRLIDEPSESADAPNATVLENIQGDVKLENVEFGYVKGITIIKNLSLHAQPGKLVAIAGPTGAGKTTLINLLMRFYDPNSGRIALDDNDIKLCTRKSLRLSYAMVLQETWLFSGTVYDNIAYGKADATMEDVIEVAKAAKLHNYIMQLPNGYDTVLSENGVNISQGQRQLMTIARAMLLDANMLILDEATSNVDTATELQIQHAMRNLMKDKTCFVIAHRLSTIQNADTILVVKDGEIVEQGVHKDLLNNGGFYSQLYYSQFEGSVNQ